MKPPVKLAYDLPAHYEISPELEDGKWNGLYRLCIYRPAVDDSKQVLIVAVDGVSSAEIFTKLGYKVPELDPDPELGIERARQVIQEGISAVGSQTVLKAKDYTDLLLDALNELGGKSVDPEGDTDDEDV